MKAMGADGETGRRCNAHTDGEKDMVSTLICRQVRLLGPGNHHFFLECFVGVFSLGSRGRFSGIV